MELKYRQFQLEVNKTLNASYNPQAYVNYYKQYIIMLQADHQIIENSQYEYDADFVAKIRQKQMQLEQLINIEEIESSLQNLHLDIQRCSKLIQIRSYDTSWIKQMISELVSSKATGIFQLVNVQLSIQDNIGRWPKLPETINHSAIGIILQENTKMINSLTLLKKNEDCNPSSLSYFQNAYILQQQAKAKLEQYQTIRLQHYRNQLNQQEEQKQAQLLQQQAIKFYQAVVFRVNRSQFNIQEVETYNNQCDKLISQAQKLNLKIEELAKAKKILTKVQNLLSS